MINSCITWPLLFSSSNVLTCSVFDNLADSKLISTLRSDKSAFYLLIIPGFLNFLVIPWIRCIKRICGIGGNFLIYRFSIFLHWSIKGSPLIWKTNNNECLRDNATKFALFIRRDLGTSQSACRDKKFYLADLLWKHKPKTKQNTLKSRDRQTKDRQNRAIG